MIIQEQLDRIRNKKPVENFAEDTLLTIFNSVVYMFRRFISPVTEANELKTNLDKIMILCRLEDNPKAYALILKARAMAQLSSSATSSEWNDLIKSSGLDIMSNSKNFITDKLPDNAISGVSSENKKDGFNLNYRGINIHIFGGSKTGSLTTNDFVKACELIDTLNVNTESGSRYIEIDYEDAVIDENVEIFDTVHDPWKPTNIYSEKLKKHPTAIIEPSTLAATPFPKATYKPTLPKEAIERGFISDAQFETIVYGLQAITNYLPGSPQGPGGPKTKGGYIIGDGTGVGKTNIFIGMILDQIIKGKKRHIIIVERSKHVKHIKEAIEMLGGNAKMVMYQGDRKSGENLPSRDGIMISTYALIRDDRRFNDLINWANEKKAIDGLLVFDEAHNMRNAIEDHYKENTSVNNRSKQGMAAMDLQYNLNDAGVVYASATIATDIYNLGYAVRLGLWGENAPFENIEDFIGQMISLDEAALEQICIDLKSAGRYCSRTLSFDGVEYEEIIHRLTPQQKNKFNQTINGWRQYSRMYAAAENLCRKGKNIDIKNTRSRYIRNQRRTVEKLLTEFNIESMIENIHEELANGNSPVIQISKTGEAQMKRILGDRKEILNGEYKDDTLSKIALDDFPIYSKIVVAGKYEFEEDANGDKIICQEALKIKDDAKKAIEHIGETINPIDRLYAEFGVDNIAEITGRSQRLLPIMEKGNIKKWKLEDRCQADCIKDLNDFQNNKKSILIFSLGAGGSGLSYHAAHNIKNKKRRIHYILELGDRSETAVQGIGRTHRSGQIIPPFVKLVTSDIPAHIIYSSKTLSKIAKMGALSKGHQHASSNAIFEQQIPLHSNYAYAAWLRLVNQIENDEVEDIKIDTLKENLSIDRIDDYFNVLNRLALITDTEQRILIDLLNKNIEEIVSNAIRSGEYNQGLQTIKSKSIQIIDENEILNMNGSKTKYYKLQKHDEIDKINFNRAKIIYTKSKTRRNVKSVFMRHKVNGKICLGVMNENSENIVDVTTPAGSKSVSLFAIRQEPWKVISDLEDAQKFWNLESENLDLREYSELHMISGSLLYNWDKLPKSGIGLTRCKTDNNEIIVGRIISKHNIKSTLTALGVASNYKPQQILRLLKKVEDGGVIDLDNGWSIDLPKGNTNYRLEIPAEEIGGILINELKNIGISIIETPLGKEFEIDKDNAIEIFQTLTLGGDVNIRDNKNKNIKMTSMAAMIDMNNI